MSLSGTYSSETALLGGLRAGQPAAFAQLYDQYAPVLLGIIVKTIDDKQRAEAVLTEIFITIQSSIESCPVNQPLFLWLFDVARQTAADALAAQRKANPAIVRLTPSGEIVTTPGQATLTPPDNMQQRLLNAVLFKRCTPQEASRAAGLPTENARQHLRQAFLQLRGEGV